MPSTGTSREELLPPVSMHSTHEATDHNSKKGQEAVTPAGAALP